MATENTNKNTKGGITGKGFDVSGQPSPEAKKRGWEIKKEAERLMGLMVGKANMTYKEALAFAEEAKKHPEKYTFAEIQIRELLKNPKYFDKYLDRILGKPTQKVDMKTDLSVNDARNYFNDVKQAIDTKLSSNKEQEGGESAISSEQSPS